MQTLLKTADKIQLYYYIIFTQFIKIKTTCKSLCRTNLTCCLRNTTKSNPPNSEVDIFYSITLKKCTKTNVVRNKNIIKTNNTKKGFVLLSKEIKKNSKNNQLKTFY